MSYLFEDESLQFESGRIARVIDLPRAGDASAFREFEFEEEIVGTDNRALVADTTPIPHRFICRLACQMAEKNNKKANRQLWLGTGILIGNRYVLTVGHNIVRQESGVTLEAEKIKIAPGYNGALANALNWSPFGTANVERANCYTNYESSGFKDSSDYGLIVLKEDLGLKKPPALKGQVLGYWGDKKYGGLTMVRASTAEDEQGEPVNLCGYQADKCGTDSISIRTDCDEAGRGSTQWSAGGRIGGCVGGSGQVCYFALFDKTPAAQLPAGRIAGCNPNILAGNKPPTVQQMRDACKGTAVLMHDADACNGASGAPIWTIGPNGIRVLMAIHRGGEDSYNYAVCLTETVLAQLSKWGWKT